MLVHPYPVMHARPFWASYNDSLMTEAERESRPHCVNKVSRDSQAGYRGLGRFSILFLVVVITSIITMAWATQANFVAHATDASSNLLPALYLFIIESTWAWMWILPAIGFGRFISARFLRPATLPFSILSIAIGAALLMFVDHALGLLGVLQFAGGVPAFILTVLGIILIFYPRSKRIQPDQRFSDHPVCSLPFITYLALAILITIPIAFLFTAALSAPGYLWDSEFGGFDALSYHLQLPREWIAAGRITPLAHNVYSFLPSYMESAYYHLAVLRNPFKNASADAMQSAAYSAQLLHAYLVVFTAAALAELLHKVTQTGSSQNSTKLTTTWAITLTFLATAFIAIPWITVVGSLAYNEIPTILFFIAALWLVSDNQFRLSDRNAFAIGFLLGSASAVKLTSFGLVVLPVVLLVVVSKFTFKGSIKSLIRPLTMIALGGFVALVPYALRNFVATGFTNPFFPFATSIFGTVHWTPEQVARFHNAHTPGDLTILDRFDNLWQMAFINSQWAYLWFIAFAAGAVALFIKPTRRTAFAALLLLFVQLVFWFFFTHMQSRFLLPCVVPLMILVTLPIRVLADRRGFECVDDRRFGYGLTRVTAVVPSGAVCMFFFGWTFCTYTGQRDGAPAAMIDAMPLYIGLDLPSETQEILAERNPVVFLNINILRLKAGAVYLLGDSTPFYLNPVYLYHTTWDTSPLGRLIMEYRDDPDQWAHQLAEQYDVKYLLINWSELARLIEKDHWYDPNVTLSAVRELRDAASTRLIRNWPPNYELLEIAGSR